MTEVSAPIQSQYDWNAVSPYSSFTEEQAQTPLYPATPTSVNTSASETWALVNKLNDEAMYSAGALQAVRPVNRAVVDAIFNKERFTRVTVTRPVCQTLASDFTKASQMMRTCAKASIKATGVLAVAALIVSPLSALAIVALVISVESYCLSKAFQLMSHFTSKFASTTRIQRTQLNAGEKAELKNLKKWSKIDVELIVQQLKQVKAASNQADEIEPRCDLNQDSKALFLKVYKEAKAYLNFRKEFITTYENAGREFLNKPVFA